jgi:hypothetical protein
MADGQGNPAGDNDLAEVPPPLKISCTSTQCEDGLHCFRATKKMQREKRAGTCRRCGVALVDWPRVHARSLADLDNTFGELRRELIRHHFWHLDIDERAQNHARRKGRIALHEAVHRRIVKSVGQSSDGNPWDGRQTPFSGNSIFYAQHATAACCRKCIEYWHAIPSDRDLTNDETDYLSALVIRYLDERLPDLHDDPQRVPRRKA